MFKKKPDLFFILSFIVIILSAVSIYFFTTKSAKIDPRIEAIFQMKDLYNNSISSKYNEFIIINFWASWCPPCIEETPSLVRFVEKHATHFTLLALSQDDSKNDINNFIKTFPALKSQQLTVLHDDSQSIARSFKVEKLPETFIYSTTQNKYLQISGSTNWDNPEVLIKINEFFKVQIN